MVHLQSRTSRRRVLDMATKIRAQLGNNQRLLYLVQNYWSGLGSENTWRLVLRLR